MSCLGFGWRRAQLEWMSSDAVFGVGLVPGFGEEACVDAFFQVTAGSCGGDGLKHGHVGFSAECRCPVPRLGEVGESLFRVHGFAFEVEHVSKRFVDDMQHVLDEGGGMACLVALGQRAVVLGLRAVNHVFKRDELKQRLLLHQDEGLPEPSHSSIAIREGVDELEFVMKHATLDEPDFLGRSEVGKQVVHQVRYVLGGRCHVGHPVPSHDANPSLSEAPIVRDQPIHQGFVRFQKRLHGGGVKRAQLVVNLNGIQHFTHVFHRAHHAVGFHDCGDLVFRQGVAFNAERRMNRLDSVFLAELRRGLVQKIGIDLPDTLRHRRDHLQDVRCDLVRWLHGLNILSFDSIKRVPTGSRLDFLSSLPDQIGVDGVRLLSCWVHF